MRHLTRWQAVAASGATAVVAVSAIGVANALDGPQGQPAPIELTSTDSGESTPVVAEPRTDEPPADQPGSDEVDPDAGADANPEGDGAVDIVSPDGPVTERAGAPETAGTRETDDATGGADDLELPDDPDSPDDADTPDAPDSVDSADAADD